VRDEEIERRAEAAPWGGERAKRAAHGWFGRRIGCCARPRTLVRPTGQSDAESTVTRFDAPPQSPSLRASRRPSGRSLVEDGDLSASLADEPFSSRSGLSLVDADPLVASAVEAASEQRSAPNERSEETRARARRKTSSSPAPARAARPAGSCVGRATSSRVERGAIAMQTQARSQSPASRYASHRDTAARGARETAQRHLSERGGAASSATDDSSEPPRQSGLLLGLGERPAWKPSA
jgi:hypothetical protein